MRRKSPTRPPGFNLGTCMDPAKLSTPAPSTGRIATGVAGGGKRLFYMTCTSEPSPRPGRSTAVGERLAYLADLGITAVELMPVADFPGQRNWGYDGVFPFAPDSTYGRPEDLKALVQSSKCP